MLTYQVLKAMDFTTPRGRGLSELTLMTYFCLPLISGARSFRLIKQLIKSSDGRPVELLLYSHMERLQINMVHSTVNTNTMIKELLTDVCATSAGEP